MIETKTYNKNQKKVHIDNYLRFGLSIDCVVFGYQEGEIKVLLIERNIDPFKGKWALIGDLVAPSSDLISTAKSVLEELTGLDKIFLEQFTTVGAVNRHPIGRVVSVGYYSLVNSINQNPVASSWAKSTKWFSTHNLPDLAFDHNEIINMALQTLKHGVRHRPVGFELLPNKFTLLALQDLYEALLDRTFDKPNFRKKILGMKLLIPLDEVESDVPHRPAQLFKFDKKRYHLLQQEGFVFDI